MPKMFTRGGAIWRTKLEAPVTQHTHARARYKIKQFKLSLNNDESLTRDNSAVQTKHYYTNATFCLFVKFNSTTGGLNENVIRDYTQVKWLIIFISYTIVKYSRSVMYTYVVITKQFSRITPNDITLL